MVRCYAPCVFRGIILFLHACWQANPIALRTLHIAFYLLAEWPKVFNKKYFHIHCLFFLIYYICSYKFSLFHILNMNASLPNNGTFTSDNTFASIRMSYRMAVERESIISPAKNLLFLSVFLKKSLLFHQILKLSLIIIIYQKKGGKRKCKQ